MNKKHIILLFLIFVGGSVFGILFGIYHIESSKSVVLIDKTSDLGLPYVEFDETLFVEMQSRCGFDRITDFTDQITYLKFFGDCSNLDKNILINKLNLKELP